jgi:hypothetical protein
MAGERIINRNPYLLWTGPGHLSPKGTMSLLRKIASLRRVHNGCRPQVIAFWGSIQVLCWRSTQIRGIEGYYKENPPR